MSNDTARYKLEPTRSGLELVRRANGGSYHLALPSLDGVFVGYWIKPTEFDNTLPWEWVITNMPVTIVPGMSSGYTRTRWGARRAVRRALRFWSELGYQIAKGAVDEL